IDKIRKSICCLFYVNFACISIKYVERFVVNLFNLCYNIKYMNNQQLDEKITKLPKLWTKDFSIIIVGSFVSMLGASVVSFAFGLLVLDKTGSTFKYALMMVAFMLPQLIVPILAGAFFDRHSRRKAIYTIDFTFTALFLFVTIISNFNYFNYWVYLFVILLFGSLNSMYMVAYDSFYPNLISKGNFSKAYAISSLLYPIASTIMVPVAGWAYGAIGVVPLFGFSVITFFFTAVVETFVTAREPHLENLPPKDVTNKISPLKQFNRDLKCGLQYIKDEKGLLVITAYFFCTMASGAVLTSLFLPYLMQNFNEVSFAFRGVAIASGAAFLYSIIMGGNTIGRMLGGAIHYKFKLPPEKKFTIAISVYVILGVLDAIVLFMPKWEFMLLLQFIGGIFAVTSFNIRTSGTQNHVPDGVRARFNGTFSLIVMAGSILGQLLGGALGEFLDARYIVLGAMIFNMIAIWTIMFSGRKHVKPIYNNEI
ncbi:MAG: MFS transporter, partial [Clostridia bacterium]